MRWSDIPFRPDQKMLRQFGILCLVFFGGIAAWRGVTRGVDTTVIVLAVLAVVLGSIGLARPAWLRPIFVAWIVAAFPIGWIISHVMLIAMYYLVITPIGLIFRVSGRDALRIRPQAGASTYWQPKAQAAGPERYFQQF
jgi:hypothetical protein